MNAQSINCISIFAFTVFNDSIPFCDPKLEAFQQSLLCVYNSVSETFDCYSPIDYLLLLPLLLMKAAQKFKSICKKS